MAKYTNIRERRETDRFGNILVYRGEQLVGVEAHGSLPERVVTLSGADGRTRLTTNWIDLNVVERLNEWSHYIEADANITAVLTSNIPEPAAPLNRHERRRAKALARKR